jgi:quercetin dioxygenase-like cupin family protein
MRVHRAGVLVLGLVAPLGCSLQETEPRATPPDGETRGGLAAAGAVAGAESAATRTPRFVPLPATMSADVELLSGHPDSAGRPFAMRIHELAGTVVPAHRHPVDEHLTVLRGTIRFGTGERFDSTALRTLAPGSYAFLPAGTTMFAIMDEESVVQVHGIGPFHIHWLDGLAVLGQPGDSAHFRFRAGDSVEGRGGPGRIAEGYASGALVQYVVIRADSSRYMATETDLRRR